MDYKQALATLLAPVLTLDEEQIKRAIEIPPQPELGDFAVPCFPLAKLFRKAPPLIAADMVSQLQAQSLPEWILEIKATGAYINVFIDPKHYVKQVLLRCVEPKDAIARFQAEEQIDPEQKVLIEYSSPNIAKPFHVGHAFSTVLGASLARIYQLGGYSVVRMNHLGDYGTQFGKLIVAYERWGSDEALKKDPIGELLRVYVKFHEVCETEEGLEDEARERFRLLEQGEKKEVALFERFREISLEEFKRIYGRLGVDFDNWNGESFYSDKIPEVVELLKEKHLLEESEGAQVVRLDELDLPPCLVLKSDGTTIYASRDLASALYRYRTYHFCKNIYVAGLPQSLHFRQVFAVLKKMGFDFADHCIHVGFGLVKFGEGVFSTRAGNVVTLEQLLDEAVAKALAIVKENEKTRSTGLSEDEMREIAERIGVGAVIFQYQKNGRERDIFFSWEEMLNFEGDSAPYMQYTGARAHSILRRAGYFDDQKTQDESQLQHELDALLNQVNLSDVEYALMKAIEDYRSSVVQAMRQNETFVISKALNSLCRQFNRFYTQCQILNATEAPVKQLRVLMCRAFWNALDEGLGILGIQSVERM